MPETLASAAEADSGADLLDALSESHMQADPNDDEEESRMDLVHQIYRLLLGGNLRFAPLGNNVHSVLDFSTGTGIWVLSFAETPPNCVFEVGDFESEWTYGQILTSSSAAFKHLNSGGYIEMQAAFPQFSSDDNTAKEAVNAHKWMRLMCESAASYGNPWDLSGRWKEKMAASVFVGVQQTILKASSCSPFLCVP
ncbi:umta methyltransferase family protein [Grosmannia clavigera kw1407]|uniref:Umta methyltransferase family protein n=1 Tax=Grosmannia clavigera (strain kw1407 / UAMH 11150) TaxID=655863 RepID=F0XAX8_GROCL|nr:umta methyltransferase family protein [Grosmannia clavigera kw1407]EFX05131.1 umta methyltransferase family protein [Grosmannia clavigera kw1407]